MYLKRVFLFLLVPCSFIACSSQIPENSIASEYKKGEFVTVVRKQINVPLEKIHQVMNRFEEEYKNNLNALFGWALKELKLQGEPNDFIMFNLKSHSRDTCKSMTHGVMDINVGFINKDHKNVRYTTKLTIENNNLTYEMFECEKVIKHVDAIFTLNPLNNQTTECNFEIRIKLHRPYNLMTMKQYRANLEWRFEKFISNICMEALKIN